MSNEEARDLCTFYRLVHLHLCPSSTPRIFRQFLLKTHQSQILPKKKKVGYDFLSLKSSDKQYPACFQRTSVPTEQIWVGHIRYVLALFAPSVTRNTNLLFFISASSKVHWSLVHSHRPKFLFKCHCMTSTYIRVLYSIYLRKCLPIASRNIRVLTSNLSTERVSLSLRIINTDSNSEF